MNVERARLLNAVKTSQVGLGLLGGCAKLFKEKVGGAKTDRAELAKLLRSGQRTRTAIFLFAI